ncbi:hypothetical protein ZWY2020_035997 [Hordeum vulgare]|nr:hypothetical protein ZWY2020_035997 [Hordeum vulgare]
MWYLCVFYHRLLDYRRPEVQSLAELFGGPGAGAAVEWRMPDNHHEDSPFHLVLLPGDERLAAQIANRSLLVKGIYELWGHGATYDELEKAIRAYPDERKLPYLTPESSFKIVGRVNLKKPDHKFFVLETDDYGSQNGLPPVSQKAVFFGVPAYELKSRKYIGPTAMDCEMAFLMANQGLAGLGNFGADIDIRVVRDGRGPHCNIWSNFEQYKLPEPLCVLRADNNLPPWRPGLKEVVGSSKGIIPPYIVPDEKRENHIPSTAPYSLAECVHDLLLLAARMLVIGGRLVFFYPVLRDDDVAGVAKFPEHLLQAGLLLRADPKPAVQPGSADDGEGRAVHSRGREDRRGTAPGVQGEPPEMDGGGQPALRRLQPGGA